MRSDAAKRVALTGMLFALAIVLSFAESALTPLLGLPPGVKLGLANVVVMYALFFSSRRQALALVVLKAGFGFLTRGATAGILSLCGGLVSFLLMVLLMLPARRPSVLLISVAGALGHNMGQLAAIRVLMGAGSLYYAPVLVISGVVMGALTATSLRVLLPAFSRIRPPKPPPENTPDEGGVPDDH